MAKLIQALGLSLILLTGSVGFAKKKEKKEQTPSVIQIAPMAYERGAPYVLNPLRADYEEYLQTHPTVVVLKNQQALLFFNLLFSAYAIAASFTHAFSCCAFLLVSRRFLLHGPFPFTTFQNSSQFISPKS